MTIRTGDTVIVLSGRDKGKQGRVEKSLPDRDKVIVTGVNIRTRHLKPSQTASRGGIREFAAPLGRAKVMLICPHCSKPTRIKQQFSEDGKKYRSCSHCQTSVESK